MVVVGGTKAAAFASGVDGSSVYTLVITPNAGFQGNLTVDVAAGVATDLAGNPNTAAAQSAQAVDTLRPDATIVVADTDLIVGETSLVTFTFTEAVTGFTNADLTTIEGGTLSTVSSANGGITWTATFTPTANFQDATNVITLNDTGVTDLAGNAGVGTSVSNNYAIDTLGPSVTVNIQPRLAERQQPDLACHLQLQFGTHRLHPVRRHRHRRHAQRLYPNRKQLQLPRHLHRGR